MKIKSIKALEILDSRGYPTIESTVFLEDGSIGRSAVPSGASTGKYEAIELRDNDPKRYSGKGVLKAVENVNHLIAKTIIGLDAEDQEKIDQTMIDLDGTENKSKLGANAILSVSQSIAKAQASSEKKPLYQYLTKFNPDFDGTFIFPIPEMNVINGGKHANWATDIQEYMLFPIGASTINQAIRMNVEIYINLREIIKKKGYSTTVGDEGGFAPKDMKNNEEPFELMVEAIASAGYTLGKDVCFGIDSAASEFFDQGKYLLNKERKTINSNQLADFYKNLAKKYPIISMEDIFAEDDWLAFQSYTALNGKKTQIVGDDLYVTNRKRLTKGIKEKATNSILIKLNQIGTVSETVKTILLAKKNNLTTIVSHRSGETEDSFIADFVVAMGCGQIKTGAPARGERTAKYNQLLRIENEIGDKGQFYKFPSLK